MKLKKLKRLYQETLDKFYANPTVRLDEKLYTLKQKINEKLQHRRSI